MARAKSSSLALIEFTRTPGAGSNSKVVTTGPGWTSVTRPRTPKSARRAVSRLASAWRSSSLTWPEILGGERDQIERRQGAAVLDPLGDRVRLGLGLGWRCVQQLSDSNPLLRLGLGGFRCRSPRPGWDASPATSPPATAPPSSPRESPPAPARSPAPPAWMPSFWRPSLPPAWGGRLARVRPGRAARSPEAPGPWPSSAKRLCGRRSVAHPPPLPRPASGWRADPAIRP